MPTFLRIVIKTENQQLGSFLWLNAFTVDVLWSEITKLRKDDAKVQTIHLLCTTTLFWLPKQLVLSETFCRRTRLSVGKWSFLCRFPTRTLNTDRVYKFRDFLSNRSPPRVSQVFLSVQKSPRWNLCLRWWSLTHSTHLGRVAGYPWKISSVETTPREIYACSGGRRSVPHHCN